MYDFPASPTEGQVFTPPTGGQSYVFVSPRWLVQGIPPASSAGPPGPAGPEGPTGPKGDKGDKGDTGTPGATGPAGGTGPTGPAGADSTVPGPQGPQGVPGNPGATGSQGIQGNPGTPGAPGATGAKGDKGDPGNTGAQGPQGNPGATGTTGATGPGVAAGGTTGQVLTKTSATDYATYWSTIVGGAIVADAAPGSPAPGQMWFKSNEGNTYIWVDDGNSTQWVMQNVMPATGSSPVATAQTRNRIVNGAMQISQENGDTAAGTQLYYMADQWAVWLNTTGVVSAGRISSSPSGAPFGRWARITVTTADTSIAAGEYCGFLHRIEGVRMTDFGYGAVGAVQSVLRFNWTSPAGTYHVALGNAAANRSFVAPFTIAAGQANVETTQTIVIPGDVTGTWLKDTSKAAELGFMIAVGSTYMVGTANTWTANQALASSSQTNGLGTVNNAFLLSNVALYLDPQNTGVAPAWQMPDEAEELRACQRYFYKVTAPTSSYSLRYSTALANMDGGTISFPVPMRIAAPVAVVVGTVTYTNCSALSLLTGADNTSAVSRVTVTATGSYRAIGWDATFSARM